MKRHARGFTLIEMVVSLVVLAVLGATAAYGINNGVLAFMRTADALDTTSKLRLTSERMAREIRQLRRDPLNTARYDVTEPFAADQLAFSKLDATLVTLTTAPPLITLSYDDPVGDFTLSDQVNALTFRYFQSDGVTNAGNGTTLAFVEFDLTLTDSNGNDLVQTTRVGLRNQP